MRVAVSKEERKSDMVTGTEEGTDEGGHQQGRKKYGKRDMMTGYVGGGHQQGS